MKNQFFDRKMVFALLAVGISVGLATMGYGAAGVSIEAADIKSPVVGEQLKINVNVTGGEGIAGYGLLLIFDATALKYVEATNGGYLPPGGIWMAPVLSDDDTYDIELSIANTTTVGNSVRFGLDEIPVENIFRAVPVDQPPPAELATPGAAYWTVSLLASSTPKVAPTGDGTLATLTFEVVDAKPTTVALLNINLSDVNDSPLEGTIQRGLTTIRTLEGPGKFPEVDVNNDGHVNILDMTFVALRFGQPVTEATQAADVNLDGEINILDLVRIAQNFGK